LDWPQDILALADDLKITEFGVVGMSGGGPYATACAYAIPERLTYVGIVCGLVNTDNPEIKRAVPRALRSLISLAGISPLLLRPMFALSAMKSRRNPQKAADQMISSLSKQDQMVIQQNDAVQSAFVSSVSEIFCQGAAGPALEAALYGKPIGFQLDQISVEVNIYHGAKDQNVPLEIGRYLAAQIPKSKFHLYPDDGHVSLIINRFVDVLIHLNGSVEGN
jgi:pimeloyl-ACP methyl ester carboxylesterase